MRIVLGLDRALNNTSLILLIEAAGRRLLFPGDAQIENWSYSLTGPGASDELTARLGGLDFYKVGHHGSRNATPKLGLLPLWRTPGASPVPVAFMSTRPGIYDEDRPVPAENLVRELSRAPLTLVRTDSLPARQTFVDHEFPSA
jgi:hypothetical protein